MPNTPEHRIVANLVSEIRAKLEDAHSISRAAESCANDGNISRSIQILMGFEGLSHEANHLLGAILAIQRSLLTDAE